MANESFAFVPLILAFPILGLLTNLAFGSRLSEKRVGIVASGASALAFAVALATLAALLQYPEGGQVLLWQWLKIGLLEISVALQVDALSTVMILSWSSPASGH